LVRRLESREEMRLMEENRLASGVNCQAVGADLEEHLADLQKRIDKTRQQIKDHINQHPDLKDKAKRLDSIPGIGESTAALLLAELGDIRHFDNARQVAAFAGLVPRIRECGSSVRSKPRLSLVSPSSLPRLSLVSPSSLPRLSLVSPSSLQGGVVTSAQSDVFPRHDGVALQSPHQGSGATLVGSR
jgi:transposase